MLADEFSGYTIGDINKVPVPLTSVSFWNLPQIFCKEPGTITFYDELFKWWHVRLRKPSSDSLPAVPNSVIELDDSGDESGDLGYVMENIKEDPYGIHQTGPPADLCCSSPDVSEEIPHKATPEHHEDVIDAEHATCDSYMIDSLQGDDDVAEGDELDIGHDLDSLDDDKLMVGLQCLKNEDLHKLDESTIKARIAHIQNLGLVIVSNVPL